MEGGRVNSIHGYSYFYPHSLINFNVQISILSLIISFLGFFYILYLTIFPFKMWVVDQATINSTSLQTHRPKIIYLDTFLMWRFWHLSIFLCCRRPIHSSCHKYPCLATYKLVALKNTPPISASCIMHFLPYSYLAYFLIMNARHLFIPFSFFPRPAVLHPTFMHPLEWLTHLRNPQNRPFYTYPYFINVDAGVPITSIFILHTL